jgi:DNA invertase Pin-like site-specific DNA recombinase
MARAGIYVRLSVNRDGTETSTQRQEQDCRRLAEQKDWDVAEVYRDTDLSAFNTKVRRPSYERMMADVGAGLLDAVICWKIDRLSRSMHDYTATLRHLSDHDVVLASYSDPVDTSTPMGRAMLHISGVFAELESDTISYRVKRAARMVAEQGRPSGGGFRPFGYDADGIAVREDEAELLREAAGRFLAGETLRRICFDWNARGIPTTTGREWSSSVLSTTLRRDRNAGWRRHGKDLHPAAWEAIINEATHLRLLNALGDSRRRTVRGGPRRHLLSGYVRCGRCGRNMHVLSRQAAGESFTRWRCRRDPGSPGCGTVSASYAAVERVVTEKLLAFMGSVDLGARVAQSDTTARRQECQRLLDEDRNALQDLIKERFVVRSEHSEMYAEAQRLLEERIRTNGAALARLRQPEGSVNLEIPTDYQEITSWWAELSLEDRRAALSYFVDHVRIAPAAHRGGNRFDVSRVEIEWR